MAVRGGDEIEGGGPAHHVPANTVHAPAQDYKFILKNKADQSTEIG